MVKKIKWYIPNGLVLEFLLYLCECMGVCMCSCVCVFRGEHGSCKKMSC